jgi:hypothetical protein
MTYLPQAQAPTRLGRFRERAGSVAQTIRTQTKVRTRPLRAHLQDHAYTLVGFGSIDAACFLHSLFCGLLVGGILVLVFEWKVSD